MFGSRWKGRGGGREVRGSVPSSDWGEPPGRFGSKFGGGDSERDFGGRTSNRTSNRTSREDVRFEARFAVRGGGAIGANRGPLGGQCGSGRGEAELE